MSVAGLPRAMPGYLNFFFCPANGFFEFQVQIVAYIFASPPASPPSAAAAEELAEDIAKNVFETAGEFKTAGEWTTVSERRMTELIVLRAFLCIGEHRISLGDFFEFFFRRFVARVPIGMVLQG